MQERQRPLKTVPNPRKLGEWLSQERTVFVSITGLELKNWWSVFPFTWYAIPSLIQAKLARGNLMTEVETIGSTRHTLTVWESRRDLLNFVYSGHHRRAVAAFVKVATGKTCHYETTDVPTSWHEVRKVYDDRAAEYHPAAPPDKESQRP